MFYLEKIITFFDKQDLLKFKQILLLLALSVLFEFLSISLLIPFLQSILENSKITDLYFFKYFDFQLQNKYYLLYLVLGIFLLRNIILIILNKYLVKFSEYLRLNISSKLFRNYIDLSYEEFVKKNSAIMLRNINDEALSLNNFVISYINLIVDVLYFIVIYAVLLFFNQPVTLWSTSVILILIFFYYVFFDKKFKIWGENRKEYTGQFIKTSIQAFNSIKEIKVLNKENYFKNYFYYQNKEVAKSTYLYRFINLLPRYVLEIIIIIFVLLYFIFFNEQIKIDNQLFINLAIYAFALIRLIPISSRIITNFNQISFRSPTLNNLSDELKNAELDAKHKKNINDQNKEVYLENFKKLIIKNLSFSYQKNQKILDNVNLEICKGEVISIIGDSGSGKSTLVNIILGLLKPKSGEILYHGEKNMVLNPYNLKEIVGCVFQSVELWDETIKENIAFGCVSKDIDIFKVNKLIKDCKLESLIKNLDKGLETKIGDRGVMLSGGQRQRIGIARALYFDPKVIIFDEATNSLDKLTENEILDDIVKSVTQYGLTLIIISHDLNLVKRYSDKIYHLTNGKIKCIK